MNDEAILEDATQILRAPIDKSKHKKFLRYLSEKRLNFYWKTRSHVDPCFLYAIAKHSKIAENRSRYVIDLGTGCGIVALYLSTFINDEGLIAGIDISRKSLSYARTWAGCLSNTIFLASDIEKLPFRDQSFDVACNRFVFHHFFSPMHALYEIHRILKVDGILITSDGVAPDDDEADNFLNTVGKIRDASHVRYYKSKEIARMIHDAGFSDIEIYPNPIRYPLRLREWIPVNGPKYMTLRKIFNEAPERVKRALQIVSKRNDVLVNVPTVIVVARKK
jgi:ubiquinone/menaquinone biosynthesis C-methylase UbiE